MPATPGTAEHPALADASATPYWLDSTDRPAPRPPLDAHGVTDLCVVGGGYSGLWTALLAKERDPDRDVVLLEGNRVGWAASGRNGGFCAASLTHGHANGQERWPEEMETLDRLGRDNLDAIEETHRPLRHRTATSSDPGAITVATEPHQVAWLHEMADEVPGSRFLDQAEIRAEVNSPTYLAGVHEPARHGAAPSGPAGVGARRGGRAARRPHPRGTRRCPACRAPATAMDVRTRDGQVVRARRVALGTNAFPAPGPPGPAAHRPGLRLRADDRAAHPRAARRGRLAQRGRAWTT